VGRKCIQHDGPVGFSNPLNMLEQNDRIFFLNILFKDNKGGLKLSTMAKEFGHSFSKNNNR